MVLGIFYGLIFSFTRPEDLNPAAIVGLILFATFIFQPIRDWLQEQLDRYFFYKDHYDHRRTLIEFARELGSETNLDHMLRTRWRTGWSTRSPFSTSRSFWLTSADAEFRAAHGARTKEGPGRPSAGHGLDLSFLSSIGPASPICSSSARGTCWTWFRTNGRHRSGATIADLDYTYYFPCTVRGRTIGWLGLSRTDKGDFLSSDDVELLVTLSGYVGIAIENARLYRSLQRKVEEYERLKEFSENIVESINVGILAADLEDRVESWNTQIEKLTGIPREAAVGRRLCELFPDDLYEKFDQVRGRNRRSQHL